MMKQWFADYRAMRVEMNRLQRDDCTLADVVRGSRTEDSYAARSVHIRGVDRERLNFNRERLATLRTRCRCVEDAIRHAPSQTLQMALQLHYVGGRPWSQTAHMLNETPAAIAKRAERYVASLRTAGR